MFITFNQFKTALLAVKSYIAKVMPKRTSDLINDSGYFNASSFPTDAEMEEMLAANGLNATIIENWEAVVISGGGEEY